MHSNRSYLWRPILSSEATNVLFVKPFLRLENLLFWLLLIKAQNFSLHCALLQSFLVHAMRRLDHHLELAQSLRKWSPTRMSAVLTARYEHKSWRFLWWLNLLCNYQAFCENFFHMCPTPATLPLNLTGWFAKPKPSPLPPPKTPSGKRLKVLHLSDFHLDPSELDYCLRSCVFLFNIPNRICYRCWSQLYNGITMLQSKQRQYKQSG